MNNSNEDGRAPLNYDDGKYDERTVHRLQLASEVGTSRAPENSHSNTTAPVEEIPTVKAELSSRPPTPELQQTDPDIIYVKTISKRKRSSKIPYAEAGRANFHPYSNPRHRHVSSSLSRVPQPHQGFEQLKVRKVTFCRREPEQKMDVTDSTNVPSTSASNETNTFSQLSVEERVEKLLREAALFMQNQDKEQPCSSDQHKRSLKSTRAAKVASKQRARNSYSKTLKLAAEKGVKDVEEQQVDALGELVASGVDMGENERQNMDTSPALPTLNDDGSQSLLTVDQKTPTFNQRPVLQGENHGILKETDSNIFIEFDEEYFTEPGTTFHYSKIEERLKEELANPSALKIVNCQANKYGIEFPFNDNGLFFLPKNSNLSYMKWTVKNVSDWVENITDAATAVLFETEQVDGVALGLIDDSMLKNELKIALGMRVKLRHAFKHLAQLNTILKLRI